MGAITNIKPSFFGSSARKNADSEKTIATGTVIDSESTLATVMLPQHYDTSVQTQFNRLMLMSQNNEISNTYSLHRKITYVGRSRRNHVRINDPLVSTKHLTVSVSDNACVANDIDSSNGTFINGERLEGSRVLKDNDEIMVGKTILRFATRQTAAPAQPKKKQQNTVVPFKRKSMGMLLTALMCGLLSAAVVFLGTRGTPEPLEAKTPPVAEKSEDKSRSASVESAKAPQLQAPAMPTSHIQMALSEYADGDLDKAAQTLKRLSTVKTYSSEGLAAKSILSKISTVQALHAQALQAQEQKRFSKALTYWDRLLMVDMELVGDRPSAFALQAEQLVQILSFDYALEAFRSKNHKKARQLCQVILKINPDNPDALALMSRIDPKA